LEVGLDALLANAPGEKFTAGDFDELAAVEGGVFPLWDVRVGAMDAVDHVLYVVGRSPTRKTFEHFPFVLQAGACGPLNPQRHVADDICRAILGGGLQMARELSGVAVALGAANVFKVAAVVAEAVDIGETDVGDDASGQDGNVAIERIDVEYGLVELVDVVDEFASDDPAENNPVRVLLIGNDAACERFCCWGLATVNDLFDEVICQCDVVVEPDDVVGVERICGVGHGLGDRTCPPQVTVAA